MLTKRLAAISLVAAAVGTTAAPAMAATSSHWSHSKCVSYANKYRHSTKSQKSAANKSLKMHGCKVTVK